MKTQLLDAKNPADCHRATTLLRQGELVAVPTETVYGLAADATQPAAVAKIFAAKERPATHPLIVHIADADAMTRWAATVPQAAWKLAAAFWPGPMTLLLPKAPWVDQTVTGGLQTIGLRVPDHPVLLALLRELDSGVAAPSANPHKRLSPTSAAQVLDGLDGRIAAVLDGGDCQVGLESTIVDLTTDEPRILRSGPLTREQIAVVLERTVSMPAQHDMAVPGNMRVHYQPRTPLQVLPRAAMAEMLAQLAPECTALVLHGEHSPAPALPLLTLRRLPSDKEGYARLLYRTLYELDQLHPARILLEAPPQDEAWAGINDRLAKAAAHF